MNVKKTDGGKGVKERIKHIFQKSVILVIYKQLFIVNCVSTVKNSTTKVYIHVNDGCD